MEGTVNIERKDGVGFVTFSHPKSNSLPGDLLERLAKTISEAGADKAIKVVVLKSEGGPFCAGASFDELKSISNDKEGHTFFMGFAKVILAIKNAPKFVIGRIHGKAVGGGVGLVAACDCAFGTENSALKLSELALGIGPFVVGPAVERKIGTAHFSSMSIDAEWRSAKWGKEVGLYSEIFPDIQALDSHLNTFCKNLSVSSPEAMQKLKEILWEGTESWETLLPKRASISGSLVLLPFSKDAVLRAEKR